MDNIYYDGNLKASLTVGSVSDINPLNAYTKDQVNELLEEKSDVNHIHEQYLTEVPSNYATTRIRTIERYDEETEEPIYKDIELTQDEFAERIGETEGLLLDVTNVLNANSDSIEKINEDLKEKAEKDHEHTQYLTEQSLEHLATEEYVNNQIDAIPEVDLSNYATKEELETVVMSDIIREIKVVDELPEVEEEGILYLVRESGE